MSSYTCPICQEDITAAQAEKQTTACEHCRNPFHTSCLLQNANHGNDQCPLCNFQLFEKKEEAERVIMVPPPSIDDLVRHFSMGSANASQRRKAKLIKSRVVQIRNHEKEHMKIRRRNRKAFESHTRETRRLIQTLKTTRCKEYKTRFADFLKEETRLRKRIRTLSDANDRVCSELSREYISHMVQTQGAHDVSE